MKIYYVDIDETICTSPSSRKYSEAKPIVENICRINELYDAGHTIVYWTARGSRKQIDWRDVTENQLRSWGCKYHELRLDKPYFDVLLDDKAMKMEDL